MKAIPTRSLKALTTLFLVLGFGLMLAGPWVVRRPPSMHRREYAQRAALYIGGFLVAISGAGLGAFVLIRRARAEYREQSLQNFKAMLDATREDQLKKQEASIGKSLMGEPISDSESRDDA